MMADIRETCEVCGYVSHVGTVAQHHRIPKSVTEQAGMPKSETVNLCCNCHFELHAWYRMKVAEMAYDPGAQRFMDKSWDEKVKDYKFAFEAFKRYKDEQSRIR
ncbi:hypothetical protein ACFL4C_03145 [Candidatus Omnitrophota bacterium]